MTACDEYQTRIVALCDNEAGDEELRLVAGHLHDCPACRAFYRDALAIRRAGTTAPVPSLSPGARQAVLDGIKAAGGGVTARAASASVGPTGPKRALHLGRVGAWVKNPPYRWAALLVIGLLLTTCLILGRTAKDLRAQLGLVQQQVAAIHKQAKSAESQDQQQKAISALYFRMAELEERVNRSSSSRRASLPAQAYDRSARQSNF